MAYGCAVSPLHEVAERVSGGWNPAPGPLARLSTQGQGLPVVALFVFCT